jgi:hypothetical protein
MTYSCKDCVAPKRYPGCHAVCPEYLEQKAEYDRIKAIRDKEREVSCAIIIDRANKVDKAMRNRMKKV